VHVNYLIITLLQIICTSAMCEPHWGHPEHIKIIPSHHARYFHQAFSNGDRLKSHLKASYPVTLIIFLVYYFCGCTLNREYSQKKCAAVNEDYKNVF